MYLIFAIALLLNAFTASSAAKVRGGVRNKVGDNVGPQFEEEDDCFEIDIVFPRDKFNDYLTWWGNSYWGPRGGDNSAVTVPNENTGNNDITDDGYEYETAFHTSVPFWEGTDESDIDGPTLGVMSLSLETIPIYETTTDDDSDDFTRFFDLDCVYTAIYSFKNIYDDDYEVPYESQIVSTGTCRGGGLGFLPTFNGGEEFGEYFNYAGQALVNGGFGDYQCASGFVDSQFVEGPFPSFIQQKLSFCSADPCTPGE